MREGSERARVVLVKRRRERERVLEGILVVGWSWWLTCRVMRDGGTGEGWEEERGEAGG